MYLSDIHTHSIASGHGTSCTISDMAASRITVRERLLQELLLISGVLPTRRKKDLGLSFYLEQN